MSDVEFRNIYDNFDDNCYFGYPFVDVHSAERGEGRCPTCNGPMYKRVEKVEMKSGDVRLNAIQFCPNNQCNRRMFGPQEDQRFDLQYNQRFESPDPMTAFNTPSRGDAQYDTHTQGLDPTGLDMGRDMY